jgi:hypothetical protein
MKAELSSLWALLFMVDTLNLRKLQILGDLKTTIDWVIGHINIQVLRLKALLNQIQAFLYALEWFSISHIYRELNTPADDLSKEALLLD